jgi:hypothetical protein
MFCRHYFRTGYRFENDIMKDKAIFFKGNLIPLISYGISTKKLTMLILSFSDNDDNCPVKTFVKLTRKLHPGCPYLFQRVAKNMKV